MGKQRNTILILGEGPTEFFYFKSLLIIPTVRFWKKAQAIEIILSQNWAA